MAHFHDQIRVVHFIGPIKPWMFHRFTDGKVAPRGEAGMYHNQPGGILPFVQAWWDIHDRLVAVAPSDSCCANSASASDTLRASGPAPQPVSVASLARSMSRLGFASYRAKWSDDIESYFKPHCLPISPPSPTTPSSATFPAHPMVPVANGIGASKKISHPAPHRLPTVADELASGGRKLRSPRHPDQEYDARYYDDVQS